MDSPVLTLLRARIQRGPAGVEDVLATLLPLMRQVELIHEVGKVGPFQGIDRLKVDGNVVGFDPELATPPRLAWDQVRKIELSGDPATLYRTAYATWEHEVGHQDPLTDLFSLGMLLASFSLGLDFTSAKDLGTFIDHRANLFEIRPDLHPVLAKVIVRMTETDRHQRAQDVAGMLTLLETYRDQAVDFSVDLARIKRFGGKSLTDKRQILLERLRERLFEISRRNRLIYHRASAQSLNLTLSSVPLAAETQSIKPDQLLTWTPAFAKLCAESEPIQLGKYLRFEEAAYLSSGLDRIITDAKRDRNEYGFSQLRLVACFLRWHNLKDEKEERIDTPLILIPVELTRKKGVRDAYVVETSSPVAEVNPALRYHIKQVYGVDLPETVDLATTTLDAFFDVLVKQVQGSEPGVTITKVSTPDIATLHERARRRLEQAKRAAAKGAKSSPGSDGAPKAAPNPYQWEFDLCSVHLGNFRYRQMSLVRDYDSLLTNVPTNAAFDSIFSFAPRTEAPAAVPPPLEQRFPVVPCDPTQLSAVAEAATGRTYIIQGPPGTGKSQTITNLIADYVARGKRVLFVCEKRAAIDVVFHRLKQQGLRDLCCLIHDSQADKKDFILDLKTTYEAWMKEALSSEWDSKRDGFLKLLRTELDPLERFDQAMRTTSEKSGVPLARLIDRRLELAIPAPASGKDQLPDYASWVSNRTAIERLLEALRETQKDGIFARHPLSVLSSSIAREDRPTEAVARHVGEAKAALQALRKAEVAGPSELRTFISYAETAKPFADLNLMLLLDPESESSRAFQKSAQEQKGRIDALAKTREATKNWKQKPPRDEAKTALEQARQLTGFFAFFKGAWWSLRKFLAERYDFAAHAVRPTWVQIFEALERDYQAQEEAEKGEQAIRQAYKFEGSLGVFTQQLEVARRAAAQPSVAKLRSATSDALAQLIALKPTLDRLQVICRQLLEKPDLATFDELGKILEQVDRNLELLPDFLPCVAELAGLSAPLPDVFRNVPLPPAHLEAGMAERTLDAIYLADRPLARFTGSIRERHLQRIEKIHQDWQDTNARVIRETIRRKFIKNAGKKDDKIYAQGRKELEHEFGKSMRYRSIRDLVSDPEAGPVIRDLKPVWLMSPLSVSDTVPLDSKQFDVVVFDEASQITLEEGIPTIFRAEQAIIVGDQMQMPPTNFFAARREEEGEGDTASGAGLDIDSNSFLAHASSTLPSTLLGWHYRSRSESLISFSNSRFYDRRLLTVPEAKTPTGSQAEIRVTKAEEGGANVGATLDRSISFHFLEKGLYVQRQNPDEANYIAHLVRGLLARESKLSLGIVAFSEAQQGEIEDALDRLAATDADFKDRLETEYEREEDGQFVGLLVKNLENIQGDERDVVILSVCYGKGPDGKMFMNFGPINQSGGEKRLNVAFSRSKKHMVVVSSIQGTDITNEYNDGANCLRNYLRYAATISAGDKRGSERVLDEVQTKHEEAAAKAVTAAVIDQLSTELKARGYEVDANVGQSRLRCDLAVRRPKETTYLGAILVDVADYFEQADILARDVMRPGLLRAFGWKVFQVLSKDWFDDRKAVLDRFERFLRGEPVEPSEEPPAPPPKPPPPKVPPPPPAIPSLNVPPLFPK